MPSPPRPFVGDIYEPRIRLSDYARQRGRDQADAIRRSGEMSAQMWGGLGQNIASTLGEIAAIPAKRQAAALLEQRAKREEQAYQEQEAAKQSEAQKAQRLKGLVQMHGGRVPNDVLVQEFGPRDAAEISKEFDSIFPKPAKTPTREIKTRNADGSEAIQIVNDTPGQTFSSAAPPKEPKLHPVTVPGPDGRPISKMFTEDQLQQGVPVYREPKASPADEPLVAIMGPDGVPVLVPRSQAAGKRPASNREQGRAVTSGDAGRVADLDTSLQLLTRLGPQLAQPGGTGALAAAGAKLWNPITQLTGWGTDAKKRQATIDQVKQIIGKALEGGVLRKEDEIKYEKILPTLIDPPEVAASKINGLMQTLDQKRQTTLDALADAGYDTSKFNERGSPLNAAPSHAPDLTGVRPGMGRRFTDGPFAGQTWSVGPDGKPFRVGG